jgi:hypothetical protein
MGDRHRLALDGALATLSDLFLPNEKVIATFGTKSECCEGSV